jgi:hypothetical protein
MRAMRYKTSQVRILRMSTTTTTTTKFVVAVIIILGFRCQYIMKSKHNPYRTVHVRLEENEVAENEEDGIHTTNEMGMQSQRREGSIRSCKRQATTAKHRHTNLIQRTIRGGEAFIESRHCQQCLFNRRGLLQPNFRIPHRGHDRRFTHNKYTRGLSEMTVFVERAAAANIAGNTAPIGQNAAENAYFCQTFGSVGTILLQGE